MSADDDDKEEVEETEGVHARNKRLKGRKAFAGLARQVLSLVPLAMVLTQPPEPGAEAKPTPSLSLSPSQA